MYKNLKVFAQFYCMSTGYVAGTIPPVFKEENKMLIPGCGSGAILPLDGRKFIKTLIATAKEECKKRNYLGFALYSGDYLNPKQLTQLECI